MDLIGGIDFEELRSQRVKNYDTITLALDTAAVDKEYIVTGNYFYIVEATDIDVEINVRINEQSRKQIRLVHGRAIRTPFYRLYLSWTPQAGKSVTLAIGVGQKDLFEISDVGKALELSGTVLVDDQGGRVSVDAGNIWTVGVSQVAVVAEYSTLCLWNNSAFNWYLYEIDIISLVTPPAEGMFFHSTSGLANLIFDARNLLSSSLVTGLYLLYGSLTTLEILTNQSHRALFHLANRLYTYNPGICITPGYGFAIVHNTVNEALSASFKVIVD